MKTKISIALLILLGIGLGILIYQSFFPKKEVIRITKNAQEFVNAEVKKIGSHIDEKGIEHAIYDDMTNVIRNANLITDSAKIWYDSAMVLTGVVKDRDKIISELTTINGRLSALNLPATENDTSYFYKDSWADIRFRKPINGKPGYFDLYYDSELNYARIKEDGGWFKKDKRYIDVWMGDNRNTINGMKSVRIEQDSPNRQITAGPLAKAQYDGFNMVTGVGAEVSYRSGPLRTRFSSVRTMNQNQSTNQSFPKAKWIHTIDVTLPIFDIEWSKRKK